MFDRRQKVGGQTFSLFASDIFDSTIRPVRKVMVHFQGATHEIH
jgi:hypothetical protein